MIACSRDGWLTDVTGVACHKLAGDGDAVDIVSAVSEAGDGFFFAKIPVTAVSLARQFTLAGFYLVDTNVTLETVADESVPSAVGDIDVLEVRDSDHRAVQDIAESAFKYSRFHLDPMFATSLANRIKREWTRSYCEGLRGDSLLVAMQRDRIVGFLAALTMEVSSKRCAIIDLVGVASEARGTGVGRALVNAFRSHYRGQADTLRVGTQIANTISLGLYRRCGFGIIESAYVFHAHRRHGAMT
jgi:ribosomal protein S18 acetylase RimI-like enzyme